MARLFGEVVASAFSSTPRAEVTTPAPEPEPESKVPELDAEQLIGDGQVFAEPSNEVPVKTVAGPRLRPFILLGTLEAEPPLGRAVVRYKGSATTNEYAVGDRVGGAVILSIGREHIWIRFGGHRKRVIVGDDVVDTPAPKPQPKRVKEWHLDDNIVVRLAKIKQCLHASNPRCARNISVRPYFEGGKMIGLKLRKVGLSNPLYQFGARKGDIIKKIDSFDLSSIEVAMEIYERLQNLQANDQLSITLIRNKRERLINVHVQN